jgi:uncharacterized membrane protein YjdF
MNLNSERFELPLVLTLFFLGGAFLLKMCYLSLSFNTLFGLIFLTIVYLYVRFRHALKLPIPLLLLVFAALQVDALGNFFRLYGRRFGPIQYDEFSHLSVQILVTPLIIWIVKQGLEASGHSLSRLLTWLFASTIIFSLSAFYEIIELWDELYFNGQRIWSKYDTATDLQWDLLGILIGAALSNLVLHTRTMTPQPLESKSL